MSWEKLTIRKEDGGWVFGTFMPLIWHCWGNNLTNPNALVSRVFRARYFPRGNFLHSVVGHNPSFAWRSIWSSRVLLKEGYRWVIGDGSSIDVFYEPWLRDRSSLVCFEPSCPGSSCARSYAPLLNDFLPSHDVARITAVPLYSVSSTDRIMWHFDERGVYTVKSGYRLCMSSFANRDHYKVQGAWDLIWRMKIPPKVWVFLWRCCRGALLTRVQLQRQGNPCAGLCVTCDRDMETV